jgi:MFS family permease
MLASLFGIADMVGKLASGWLADRFGNRTPLALMCLVGAAGAALIGATQGTPTLVVGLFLVGATGAIWTLLASATATEFGQASFGRAFGVICTFTPFGSLAPPVVAWAREHTGSFSLGFYGLAGLALVGALLSLLLKERKAAPTGA